MKHMIRDVAKAVSGEVPATYTEEILKGISVAMYVATFADCMAFTKTLQRHKEDFSLLLQHMADCYKMLFADKSSCASVDIIHLANEFKSIHALHKNILRLPC